MEFEARAEASQAIEHLSTKKGYDRWAMIYDEEDNPLIVLEESRPEGFVLVSIFHPALMLRGIQARFIDPMTSRDVRPASHQNQISDYVMGIVRSGLRLEHMSEHAVDEEMATRLPRSAKYQGWPLLLLMRLRP